MSAYFLLCLIVIVSPLDCLIWLFYLEYLVMGDSFCIAWSRLIPFLAWSWLADISIVRTSLIVTWVVYSLLIIFSILRQRLLSLLPDPLDCLIMDYYNLDSLIMAGYLVWVLWSRFPISIARSMLTRFCIVWWFLLLIVGL